MAFTNIFCVIYELYILLIPKARRCRNWTVWGVSQKATGNVAEKSEGGYEQSMIFPQKYIQRSNKEKNCIHEKENITILICSN